MKTGTTFLQDLMSANKEALSAAGFLFPGERWADQSRAVRDILGFSSSDPYVAGETAGMWEKISGQMLEHRGKASILSMEFLSFTGTEEASRIVESLRGADVHVVLTVRDAAATIPAQWQTTCRNGGKVTFRKFVDGVGHVLDDDPAARRRAGRMWQRTQGVPRMLDVWVPLVGRKRVHVVTVPPRGSDPELLWTRFAGVVGVDPEVCADRTVDANPSLGLASTELLRRVNAELGEVSYYHYTRTVKRQLARAILGSRAHLESRVVLNRKGRRLAARWNATVQAAMENHGVELVGTFDDLPVTPPGPEAAPKALPAPSSEQLLEAAATAVDGLRSWAERLDRALEEGVPGDVLSAITTQLGGSAPGVVDLGSGTSPERWAGEQDPVQAAVREITALVRTCIERRDQVRWLEHTDAASSSPAAATT